MEVESDQISVNPSTGSTKNLVENMSDSSDSESEERYFYTQNLLYKKYSDEEDDVYFQLKLDRLDFSEDELDDDKNASDVSEDDEWGEQDVDHVGEVSCGSAMNVPENNAENPPNVFRLEGAG